MKIEIGKYYLDNIGNYHHIVSVEGQDYIDHYGSTYNQDGKVYGHVKFNIDNTPYESPYNLVSEIHMYSLKERKDLYHKVLQMSTIERQLMHLQEEYSEMFIEMSHLVRGRKTTINDLLEEFADITIMLEEMKYAFGINEKDLEVSKNLKFKKFTDRIADDISKLSKSNPA